MPAQVTINKAELLNVLTENRGKHRDKFLAAQQAYRARVIEILDARLADAREGREINMAFKLPVPQDHTSDYDTEIRMLNMEVANQVTLRDHEFEQLVMDNWSWTPAFAATNAVYAVE